MSRNKSITKLQEKISELRSYEGTIQAALGERDNEHGHEAGACLLNLRSLINSYQRQVEYLMNQKN
ncbi:hypothetical protein GF354_01035 [Candidatus Peregrinibacteria bacterium]|nr:hypothetical protein [Candidatus Peregrinibacteria bacterium]